MREFLRASGSHYIDIDTIDAIDTIVTIVTRGMVFITGWQPVIRDNTSYCGFWAFVWGILSTFVAWKYGRCVTYLTGKGG